MEEMHINDINSHNEDENDFDNIDEYNSFNIDNLFAQKKGKYEGYIKSKKEVKHLLLFLKNKKVKPDLKFITISLLIELFYNYPLLIDIISSQKINNQTLSEILILTYIDITINKGECDNEFTNSEIPILELLGIINNHIDIPRSGYASVYHHFSKYYRKEIKDNLTNSQLLSLLKLLSVLYGSKNYLDMKRIENTKINYFYFKGDTTIQCTPDYGYHLFDWTIVFLLKKENPSINHQEQHQCISLFEIITTKSNMKLIINNDKLILLYQDKEVFVPIDFPNNKWVILKFSMSTKGNFIIQLNGKDIQENIIIGELFTYNLILEEVHEINLLQNFIGLLSSLIVMNYFLDSKHNKNKFKKEEDFLNKIYNYIIEDTSLIILPEYYNWKNKEIDSQKNQLKAKFIPEKPFYTIHFFNQHIYKVALVGGINSILPILELMYTSKLLNEETFIKFLSICNTIISNSIFNLQDAIENCFFQSLSLFIQRFPPELFTDRVFQHIILIHENCLNIAKKK